MDERDTSESSPSLIRWAYSYIVLKVLYCNHLVKTYNHKSTPIHIQVLKNNLASIATGMSS